jgi:hypothetical protein
VASRRKEYPEVEIEATLRQDPNDGLEGNTTVGKTVGIIENNGDGFTISARLLQEVMETCGAQAGVYLTFRRLGRRRQARTDALQVQVQVIETSFPIAQEAS